MLVSLLYRLLLVLLGVLVRRAGEGELEIIVLRHQLAVLRRGGKRPRYTTADRALLAAASRLLAPERYSLFLVSAQTLRRWHRALLLGKRTAPRKIGRPPLAAEIRSLIERLARENPSWGYMRIEGELKGLGIGVSATTVANVLRRGGLGPAPRRIGPSWSQFLRAQAESLVGGSLDSGLADGLEHDAGAASRLPDDRSEMLVEVDDERAPAAQPRTAGQPRPSPSHPQLARAEATPQIERCHRSHARDGPACPSPARSQPRAQPRRQCRPQRAGYVTLPPVPPPRSVAHRAPAEASQPAPSPIRVSSPHRTRASSGPSNVGAAGSAERRRYRSSRPNYSTRRPAH